MTTFEIIKATDQLNTTSDKSIFLLQFFKIISTRQNKLEKKSNTSQIFSANVL